MPTTVNWRGAYVDPETALFLDAVAAEVTAMCKAAGVPDFTVMPIPGYGSYRQNAASAGTDSGGGHCDLNAEPLTDVQARILESAARSKGGTAYFRPRTSPTGYVYGWQRHVHVLRTDCTDLSAAALKQVGQYRAGYNGLADNGRDTGNRSWVNVLWANVKAAAAKPAKPAAPAAPTPPPEDDMPRLISAAGRPAWALTDGVTATPLPSGIDPKEYAKLGVQSLTAVEVPVKLYDTLVAAGNGQQTAALAGQIAGLAKALEQVGSGQGVDLAAVAAAAKDGAQAAIDAKIASADVNLNVAP